MRLLIYAFGSWGRNRNNISERVLKLISLPVEKKVLQVRFGITPYREIVEGNYDYVLGLGQYPRGKKLRLERIAFNSFGTRKRGYIKIEVDGPEQVVVNWVLPLVDGVRITYDPGRFVCNFSMYQIMRLKTEKTKFAFIHIPKLAKVEEAVKLIEVLVGDEMG